MVAWLDQLQDSLRSYGSLLMRVRALRWWSLTWNAPRPSNQYQMPRVAGPMSAIQADDATSRRGTSDSLVATSFFTGVHACKLGCARIGVTATLPAVAQALLRVPACPYALPGWVFRVSAGLRVWN